MSRARSIRLLQGLLLAGMVAFTVSTVPGVRAEPGFDTALDGWLQGGAYVTAGALALLAAARASRERMVWFVIAAGVATRAIAFVLYLGFVRHQQPQPYPSVADGFWLLSGGLFVAGLVLLVASRLRRVPSNLLLDGVVGALATAGVALALMTGTLRKLTADGIPADAITTNVAYPAIDVVLLLMIVAVLVAYRWRPPSSVACLAVGIVGFAVIDCVFLHQVATGSFRPGTMLQGMALPATVAIAFAATMREERRAELGPGLPGLLLPGAFAIACLATLVTASIEPVPVAAVLLCTAGLGVVIFRMAVSFRELRAMAEIRREARTDELTGLANRRAFNERLRTLVEGRASGRPLALLILDLDDFKIINDELGHHHGDELLMQLAPRLQVSLRADDLLARIGGDEFAVLLDGADDSRAARVAERLLAALRRPFTLGQEQRSVTGSVGIARFPLDAQDPSELLRVADLAMYSAKTGRLGFTFYEHERDHGRRLRRPETVERLGQAIRSGQLVVHYQPLVSLETGAVVGAEGLVRWEHPTEGVLAPGAFLPQAESGGLMGELTTEVLRQAIGQLAAWRAAGHDFPVSVNLSVSNLLDDAFPAQVLGMLERAGVPGDRLVLELTEDLFLADPERGRRVLDRLLAFGVRLVVDDYGTGYSSLGYLRDLPGIGGLKLDRSFVDCVDRDPRCEAIVASTVALAEALSLSLVAEGVETASVRDRLRDLGCRTAQGYLFARPGPADSLIGSVSYSTSPDSER